MNVCYFLVISFTYGSQIMTPISYGEMSEELNILQFLKLSGETDIQREFQTLLTHLNFCIQQERYRLNGLILIYGKLNI